MDVNAPFSRRRLVRDLTRALPALGLLVGGAVGGITGLVVDQTFAAALSWAAFGVVAGVVGGLLLRATFPKDQP